MFVTSDACKDCHAREHNLWLSSQHQLAMQKSTPDAVQGNFNQAVVNFFGETTVFSKSGNAFFVRTTDVFGEPRQFRVVYTIGIEPLQQYLLEGERGRLQAFTAAWDTRPAEIGGQRWYNLYPNKHVNPNDPLHWTGPLFTWNLMCAECHSTGLAVAYDIDSDTFATRYEEISVGCEACHGPGSRHIKQANAETFDEFYGFPVDLDDRGDGVWKMNPVTGIAELDSPGRLQQPESCGRCHSHRAPIAENYEYGQLLTQTHIPSLLEEGLYHADGRILDETYVYGSFLQSKMYTAGVTCSDCHDPHAGDLRTGRDPNAICATCHLPGRFATADHSPDSIGQCVTCHMRSQTYMGVDDRRDHSFRIPSAGISSSHYGRVIAAGRQGDANAVLIDALTNNEYPGIVRATLLSLLDGATTGKELAVLSQHLTDNDPLVRIGALRGLQTIPQSVRKGLGIGLLKDPIRAVRIQAAVTFLEQRDLFQREDAVGIAGAIDELRESLRKSAAVADAALTLAELESRLGNTRVSARYYRHVLKIEPDHAAGHHAYGLFLVRQGQQRDSLPHFERAVESEPDNPRYKYVLAVALESLGQRERSLEIMRDARSRFPDNLDIGLSLATMLEDTGEHVGALRIAEELLEQFPESHQVRELVRSLR